MIKIKTKEEIEIMAANGKILASILKEVESKVKPGITTEELNRVAETLILNSKGIPSFKNYDKYPATLCTSINEEIVHGVPGPRILKEGDIISLDIGMKRNGFHSDMATTVGVGKISPQAQRLIWVTKKAFKRGVKNMKVGSTLGDVGNTIQRYVEDQGFGVVRELCGHGIGRELHEDPQILNYGKRHTREVIEEGMVLYLEPMVTVGDWRIEEDGFCYKTADNSLSAHYEHTIAITKSGPVILTI